jgi:hypothetical protein
MFEVGPDIEDTFVDISMDGLNHAQWARSSGAQQAPLILWLRRRSVAFMRLTDDTNEGDKVGLRWGPISMR